jgi:hypothetical protein
MYVSVGVTEFFADKEVPQDWVVALPVLLAVLPEHFNLMGCLFNGNEFKVYVENIMNKGRSVKGL